MAVWQFDLYLIPLKNVRTPEGILPAQLTQEVWEQGDWWHGLIFHPSYAQRLDEWLPRCQFWNENPYCWGCEIGDFLEISVTDKKITRIFLRINTVRLDPCLLEQLVQFANLNDFVFLRLDNLQFFAADFKLMFYAIESFSA
jgi:hypothetical protein